MTTRAKWTAALAALGALTLAGAASGVALAGTPGGYKLNLSVPETAVLEGSHSSITAHGNAPIRAQLEVLVTTRDRCSGSAGLEKTNLPKPKVLINEGVDKNFSHTARYLAPKGEHRACAYLYKDGQPFFTLARAEGSWRVSKQK